MPSKQPEKPGYKSLLGKSELNLRKSAIPKRPNYQTTTDAFARKSYFQPRSTEMKTRRANNLFTHTSNHGPGYMDNIQKSQSYVPGMAGTVNAESTMMWQSGSKHRSLNL